MIDIIQNESLPDAPAIDSPSDTPIEPQPESAPELPEGTPSDPNENPMAA